MQPEKSGLSKNLWIYGLKFVLIVALLQLVVVTNAQFSLSGKVLNQKTKQSLSDVSITIAETDLWGITDQNGIFRIENIPSGKNLLRISRLNFAAISFEIVINRNINDTVFFLKESNLTLDDVSVTAVLNKTTSTAFTIDRTALDHIQMTSVADAMQLLPGGKTNKNLHLATSDQNIAVNGRSGEVGDPLFGVGIEVDGVRLSPNAIPGTSINPGIPVDVRNIASANIESMEVVKGLPSVEYGDMTSGMLKINTRKGPTKYILELLTKPNTKQVALSKGFDLGGQNGILNASMEHTKSISNIAAPNTSYDRNSLTLKYTNTFNQKTKQPILLDLGFTGNIGGSDTKSDPDKFVNTYSQSKDNVLRGNFSVKWLLHKKWITNLEAAASANYNDQQSETSTNRSASSSVAALHAMETGYFVGQTYEQNPDAEVLLVAPGYWYEKRFNDSKALNYNARVKAGWSKKIRSVFNSLQLGAEYIGSKNKGRGLYFEDIRYAPTWRPYAYSQEPAINNYAVWAEDKLRIPIRTTYLQLVGGLRSDFTSVGGSEYGIVSSMSPRFTARYTILQNRRDAFLSDLSIWGGWGKSVKLPSFNILYRMPSYRDILAFAPGTTSAGETFYAYYSTPYTRIYNPDLKWQSNIQSEVGIEFKVLGTAITIVASQSKTNNPYSGQNLYMPFTYKFTDQSNLEGSKIPVTNRIYSIDGNTGIVTVMDKTGLLAAETLGYREFTRFNASTKPINGSPASRKELSWILEFKRIQSLRTSFRLDGSYYSYKFVNLLETASMPVSSSNMADGSPYKYIGFYTGAPSYSNGQKTKNLDMNIIGTTHIPAIRLIISARFEASLYNYSQNLSEGINGASRGFVLDSRDSYLPSATIRNIYGGDRFVGVYPNYYTSLDDLNTRIPFAEKFLWAKDNDPALYNELSKLVERTNYNYSFNPNKTSFYYSANINVTKEIKDFASITFNATNFLNNMSKVRSSWTNGESTLYESPYIPGFYYGISLKLKF